jgi:hypothetical protein
MNRIRKLVDLLSRAWEIVSLLAIAGLIILAGSAIVAMTWFFPFYVVAPATGLAFCFVYEVENWTRFLRRSALGGTKLLHVTCPKCGNRRLWWLLDGDEVFGRIDPVTREVTYLYDCTGPLVREAVPLCETSLWEKCRWFSRPVSEWPEDCRRKEWPQSSVEPHPLETAGTPGPPADPPAHRPTGRADERTIE